jgi:hypothetical protein
MLFEIIKTRKSTLQNIPPFFIADNAFVAYTNFFFDNFGSMTLAKWTTNGFENIAHKFGGSRGS